MPFSAEICITNSGNTQLGPVFYVYSDLDFYATPFNTNLLTEDLIGVCPYVLDNIPEGALIVLLKDISNGCCIYISLEPTIDLCAICDVGFNEYSANTVSVISVGDLTGSCENNITDYKVNWYGPDSSTNVQFTSGSGTTFNYNWEHPLTGTSSVFVPPGVYIPEIDSVILNGVTLQETEGALSDCFLPITVEAFNCSNGNNTNQIFTTLSAYSHVIQFSNQSQGTVPPNLSAVFDLSANTNFLAFAFRGESIPDAIKFLFSGVSYSTPLVLEYMKVGSNLTANNLNPSVYPKSASTSSFFSKVLNLQDTVTVLHGDYLIIEIEVDPTNENTDWTLYLKCLETFDCNKCIDTNTPNKIIASSITGITGSCGDLVVRFMLTGCTTNQNNTDDVFKYILNPGFSSSNLFSNNNNNIGVLNQTSNLFYNSLSCFFSNQPPNFPYTRICIELSPEYPGYYIDLRSYRPNSTTRVVEFKFENLTDFNAYFSNFLDAIQYSGSSDPTNITYYSRLVLDVPTVFGDIPCGDNDYKTFIFNPQTLNYATGTTVEDPYAYTFSITANTISNGTTYTLCDQQCTSIVSGTLFLVNDVITGTSYDISGTTTVSSRYQYPFRDIVRFSSSTSSDTSDIYNNSIQFTTYANQTYVASGNPLQNIVTLSATNCDFSSSMTPINYGGYSMWFQMVSAYKVERTNPSNPNDFRIMASVITNGNVNYLYEDIAYGFSGGAVYASNPIYIQS